MDGLFATSHRAAASGLTSLATKPLRVPSSAPPRCTIRTAMSAPNHGRLVAKPATSCVAFVYNMTLVPSLPSVTNTHGGVRQGKGHLLNLHEILELLEGHPGIHVVFRRQGIGGVPLGQFALHCLGLYSRKGHKGGKET